MRLQDLQARLSARRDAYNRRVGQRDAILSQLQQVEQDLIKLDLDTKLNEQVRYLLQKTSEAARESARQVLEETVTSALQYVFGPDYSFSIEIEQKAGRTEASFYVRSPAPDSTEMMSLSPEDARGGGVVDIVSLALRLAMLRIHRNPKVADVLIMDEPMRMLSEEYAGMIAAFLRFASHHFGIQVLMVTHNESLAASGDRAFLVDQHNGTSSILPISGSALPGAPEQEIQEEGGDEADLSGAGSEGG